jgi:hypothetical protein
MKYRKKPVEIEAVQWTGSNKNEVKSFMNGQGEWLTNGYIGIPTLEGTMIAAPGDYIIKGVCGEYYPCKSDIFQLTYEPV